MVVENDAGSADPFWNNAARDVLKALILDVLTDDGYAGYRNLVTVAGCSRSAMSRRRSG